MGNERQGQVRITDNFHLEELACKDGTPVPREYRENAFNICVRAQALRTLVGPLAVTSGYRTLAWNERVKGAKTSHHLTASALDLRSDRWTAIELAELYAGLVRLAVVPAGGLGIYEGWIHIDLGRPRRWTKLERE